MNKDLIKPYKSPNVYRMSLHSSHKMNGTNSSATYNVNLPGCKINKGMLFIEYLYIKNLDSVTDGLSQIKVACNTLTDNTKHFYSHPASYTDQVAYYQKRTIEIIPVNSHNVNISAAPDFDFTYQKQCNKGDIGVPLESVNFDNQMILLELYDQDNNALDTTKYSNYTITLCMVDLMPI